jgi:polysaccharide pyruvyl transferase WcaK-like protein
MTVALLSPCGWGNLGDAAIMAAAIDQIRARQPDAEVVAITLNPIDTQQRHGIPAFGIDAFTLAGFSVDRAGLKGSAYCSECGAFRAASQTPCAAL